MVQQQALLSLLGDLGRHQTALTTTSLACPFAGELYPPAANISATSIWQNAVLGLRDTITEAISATKNVTSMAVQVVFVGEISPAFEYYNHAPGHLYGDQGNAPLDGDAVFRIASTSKMLAVYALLLECGFECFEHPITDYVPELKGQYHGNDIMEVNWEDVTVGSLASHMSGIGNDYALGDLASAPNREFSRGIGLPDLKYVNETDIPMCGANVLLPSCNRSQAIELTLKHPPNFPNWHTPSYSNMAFQLIGYVIEQVTERSFQQVMDASVFRPLGMHRSSVTPPTNRSSGVLIEGDEMFWWDVGDHAPAGGMYASTSDLARHALAVLNHTQMAPSQTRRWFQPSAHSQDLYLSFGMPWEIIRRPGADSDHVLDVYTKAGNMDRYSTQYGIIPDLQMAFVANAYSQDPSAINAWAVSRFVTDKMLGVVQEVAKQQAAARFGGTFVDSRPGVNSSLTISTDDSPGLIISHFVSDGTDVLAFLKQRGMNNGLVRLFPAALASKLKSSDGLSKKVAFRALFTNTEGGPNGGCVSWGVVDGLRFAGFALDMVVFEVKADASAQAEAVDLPAYRRRLVRVST